MGITKIGIHYTINKALRGVKAGRWNFDIKSKTSTITNNLSLRILHILNEHRPISNFSS